MPTPAASTPGNNQLGSSTSPVVSPSASATPEANVSLVEKVLDTKADPLAGVMIYAQEVVCGDSLVPVVTNESGVFEFTKLRAGEGYELTPRKVGRFFEPSSTIFKAGAGETLFVADDSEVPLECTQKNLLIKLTELNKAAAKLHNYARDLIARIPLPKNFASKSDARLQAQFTKLMAISKSLLDLELICPDVPACQE
jgi:hypothetical protein